MSNELSELRKISKILLLANAKVIEDELSKYATTDSRKKIWVHINGKRMSKDIAQCVGIKRRAVYLFLNDLEQAELIENPKRKPPKKIIDYVPPSWLKLIEAEVPTEEEEAEENEF